LNANLPKVVRKQLRLEQVDYVKIGKLVDTKGNVKSTAGKTVSSLPVPNGYANADDYLNTRKAVTMLRAQAAKNEQRLNGWEDALLVSEHSPIEIRGILKRLQAKNPAITDYKINQCFRPSPWRKRVRL